MNDKKKMNEILHCPVCDKTLKVHKRLSDKECKNAKKGTILAKLECPKCNVIIKIKKDNKFGVEQE